MRQPIKSRIEVIGIAALVGALVALPSGVRAQPAAGASPAVPTVSPTPAGASGAAAALAEEIAVLRAVKPLHATPEQLTALTTAVTQAQERLAQQTQADLRALAALREPTARARQQLLPQSVDLNDPQIGPALLADQQVANAQRVAEQNQARLRGELSAGLRQQFTTLLTEAQAASVVAQGRALLAAEQAQQAQQRQQRQQQFQQAMAARGVPPGGPGGPGGQGGGPGGGRGGRGGRGGAGGPGGPGGPGGRGPMGMLDRLRGLDTQQYQQMAQGLARRFGDEGTPAYQRALAMMDQIRSMPEGQFQQQGAALMQQFGAGMAAGQSGASAADTISADHALDTWIERYLLSPQAPAALKDLSTAASGTKGAQ